MQRFLIFIHSLLAIIPVLLILFLSEVISYLYFINDSFFIWIIFPIFAFTCGGAGCYQFPLASKLYFGSTNNKNQNAGILYGIDILGVMVGMILLTILMIPLFGFYKVAYLILILNSLFAITFQFNLKK